MKRFILIHILICTIAFAFTSCKDESVTDIIWGEGSAKISATLDFRPMSTGLAQTKAAGDALKDISSLHVLLYDSKTNKLVHSQEITESEYTQTDIERSNADAENNLSAEAKTKQLSFELDEIPFGAYYMYAVANIPDLLTTYESNIQSVDGLKSLPLTWDADDISKNGQMIGYFTTSDVVQQEDVPLVLNAANMNLHAWLRRAASKVTIAYDGSKLKEGVFIYIESVQIKDIPSQCYLGKDNNVGGTEYNLDYPESGPDMNDGEIIKYHEEGNHETENFEYGEDCVGHRVTVGSPHLGSHEETAPALYFYENMQGEGDNMPDKRQDADGNGELDHPGLPEKPTDPDKKWDYRLKDDVPYGTYIEVKGHYISNNSERLGNGPITYRFMLGQDTKKDYNAKRNCHYKLTLQFKNFANEADWHIEYEEPVPGVMTPEPYYISYLYNHSMMYPIKVNTGGRNIEYIKAEIIDNRWAPHNANTEIYYYKMDKPNENKWNGFLSLHKTIKTVLDNPGGAITIESNKKYYEDPPKRGEREYREFTPGEHLTESVIGWDDYEDDKYRVEKHKTEANTYNIYIPMYTRAKQMITTTGYTGNNPYVAYQRRAEVKITTKLSGLDKAFENIVPIYQVRRIVNPKGIYRSSGNTTPFHVLLKRLPQENATIFQTFQSEGPWRAYVVKESNGNNITLSSSGQSKLVEGDPIYGNFIQGKTGSEIDFTVNFNGDNMTQPVNHYAIIRVDYHNYTCQHLIFVRQGNNPDYLVEGGALWYAENMKTKTERASTPLDEGSLFKFGNWDDPIDALNNKNPKQPWIRVEPTDFTLHPKEGFSIAGNEESQKNWKDITHKKKSETFDAPSKKMRIAQGNDYGELLDSDDIEQGYGILYGDEATETANDINVAYGYDYKNKDKRGMRGCFVYNKVSGKSLFFPIGASGYGHRRRAETGVLRYSAGRTDYYPEEEKNSWGGISKVEHRPLFYDLFRRPGAIYWCQEQTTLHNKTIIGWDFNYFTFDFNYIETSNLMDDDNANGSDACFIRCVVNN